MAEISIVRLIIGSLFLAVGLFAVLTSVIGVFRFKFCLNRLHASAIGDTGGVFFMALGMAILTGFQFTTLKILLVVVLFWISCPVTSHLLVKLELRTDKQVKEEIQEVME